MRKPRIRIVPYTCRRCGKETSGLNRPIHGSQAMHSRFAGICSDCTTTEERDAMLEDMAQGIIRQAR